MIYSSIAARIEERLPVSVQRQKNQIEHQVATTWGWMTLHIRSKRPFLLRWGVPLLIILAAIGMGRMVVIMGQRGLNPYFLIAPLFIPFALIALSFIITRFEWSAVMILFAAIFIPIKIPTGTASTIVDSLLIAFIFTGNWIFKMLLVDRRITLRPSPINVPFFGFAIITFISMFWSLLYIDPLVHVKGNFIIVQAGAAIVNVMLPITLFLVSNHIDDMKQLHIMVILVLIGGALAWVTRFGGVKLPAPLGINDDGMFTMWVAVLGFSMAMYNKGLNWKSRIVCLIVGIMLQFSRFLINLSWLAGWLPGIIALAVLVFRRSKLLVFLVVIGAVLFIFVNLDTMQAALEEESTKSGDTRQFAWQVNWRITGKHLLFGTGQAAYLNYYESYFGDLWVEATHNTIMDILAQNGFFGLFFVFWYCIALILYNYKLCLRLEGRNDFAEALANACFAGTVSSVITMAFGDWLFPFAYTQTIAGYDYIVYSWIFMGVGLAVDRLVREEEISVQNLQELSL
ncbi:O-antigen ligase family protein [Anaerolineales bacterium HSG25]|nr:O-antigen ligase family protein [Anaerolineales bacterium HSG25]